MHTQPAFNPEEFHRLYRGKPICLTSYEVCVWPKVAGSCSCSRRERNSTAVAASLPLWQVSVSFVDSSFHSQSDNDPFQCRAKPMEYISWLLGHEGEGSVLHHLKKKWALTLKYKKMGDNAAGVWGLWLNCHKLGKKYVRSGIRTQAYMSRLRPERSALDRSAILTCLSFHAWAQ